MEMSPVLVRKLVHLYIYEKIGYYFIFGVISLVVCSWAAVILKTTDTVTLRNAAWIFLAGASPMLLLLAVSLIAHFCSALLRLKRS